VPDSVTGGAAVIDSLVAQGVRAVFGIPGTHNLELYRYLPDSGIRQVVTRHEQGAGYAADGYARTSGGPGVLITTSGPGITNAMTALATAYADSVPVLAVSPGPPRGQVGADAGWLHEVKNQQGALAAVCGTSIRVEAADEVPDVVSMIFERFASNRPRPVHLEVPVDVLEGDWARRDVHPRRTAPPTAPSGDALATAARVLATAKYPLVIAGGGSRGASDQVTALADRGIPVLTTVNGKGVVDEDHPAALGASLRLPSAHTAANEADVLVVVGSELGDSDLWGGKIEAGREGDRTILRIDIEPAQLHKNVAADLPILGDAALVLDGLLARLGDGSEVQWDRGIAGRHRERIAIEARMDGHPWAEMQRSLAEALPPDTVVAGDSSQVTYYGTVHHWPFTRANRLVYPTGYATLGYGLPAAIGAKVAAPSRPVVALFGDGAAMFSIQEIVTAVEQGLSILSWSWTTAATERSATRWLFGASSRRQST
jgi:acetolactate synthase-1/2/3 large subunit